MQKDRSVKFWLESETFEFVKVLAIMRQTSMSDLFRGAARLYADEAKKLMKQHYSGKESPAIPPGTESAAV